MPQQELLTQNELLKQQVGQETELLEAGRELHVLARSLVWPGAAPAALVGVSAVVVGSGGPSSASSRPLQLEGPQPWAIISTHVPGAWHSWWGQGWQHGDGKCLGKVFALSQVHPHPSLLPGEDFRRGLPAGAERQGEDE